MSLKLPLSSSHPIEQFSVPSLRVQKRPTVRFVGTVLVRHPSTWWHVGTWLACHRAFNLLPRVALIEFGPGERLKFVAIELRINFPSEEGDEMRPKINDSGAAY